MIGYDPCQLHAVIGLPRKGKTALVVLLAKQAYESGALVYSNVVLSGPGGEDWRAADGRLDADDPKHCLEQVIELCRKIKADKSWNIPRFLFLDEFKRICDSHNWKALAWTDQIWSQIGKLGITAFVIDQSFTRIYNGYRDITAYKYVVMDQFKRRRYSLPECAVVIASQDPNNHEDYKIISRDGQGRPKALTVDLSPAFPLYDTHQLLYF